VTTYTFASLNNSQHLAFDPLADLLDFGNTGTAAQLRIVQGANLKLTLGTKSVFLDGLALGALRLESIGFGNGSVLIAGDGTASTLADWYGQFYDNGAATTGSSYWALGGADVVEAGSGADWIVGNIAYTPLNHVSRDGATGSTTNSSAVSISADGRFVAFAGAWTGYGSPDDAGTDVIVKDMNTGDFGNEHRTADDVPGGSDAASPVISADGSQVVFVSNSANLVQGNPPSGTIYLAGTTTTDIEAVSTTAAGAFANRAASNPDLSADGKFVVFECWADNLNANGSTTATDIYLKNTDTGALRRVSTSTTGTDGNAESLNPKISADGRFVVFQSDATNLSTGDTNGYTDIFLFDRSDNSVTNLTGELPGQNLSNACRNPDVAFDDGWGGVVVFETARRLLDGDADNATDIYAMYLSDGSLQLVSADPDGNSLGGNCGEAAVSGDGRFVVFRSYADTLAQDSNGYSDVYVKDLISGAIALVSRAADGSAGNQYSSNPEISLGGDWIVFESGATSFAGTDGNGGLADVFRVSNPLLVDVLRGGAGNDTYVIARATDVVEERQNAGTDTVESSVNYTLGANLENLVLSGNAGLRGTGNALGNVITGNAGNNVLNGADGKDTASYASAATGVTVSLAIASAQATGAGSDRLSNFENLAGSSFADRLTGSSAANRVEGSGGSDTLAGGGGNDTLLGGFGADQLAGGAGGDRLTGNEGADTFRFDNPAGGDTVSDFLSGSDRLQFALGIGDGDNAVEGAVTRGAAGGFAASAELVIFTANQAGLGAAAAAAAIGSATAAYAVGAKRLFVVDDGSDSAVYLFTAADANAGVSAAELTRLATLDGTASTVPGDYLFAV
jgi:Tol biopolymer transport system component